MAKIPEYPFLTTLCSWNIHGEGARSMYRDGYLNAAKILCDAIQDDSKNTKVWSVIYPVVYLFRHFVELYMKDFIDLANTTGIVDVTAARQKLSHDLLKTYELFKTVHEKVFGSDFTEMMEEDCKDAVEFLGKLDDKGDRLRYPLDRKKQPQFLDSIGIDLPRLRKQVEAFESFIYESFDDLRKLLDPDADDEEMLIRSYFW